MSHIYHVMLVFNDTKLAMSHSVRSCLSVTVCAVKKKRKIQTTGTVIRIWDANNYHVCRDVNIYVCNPTQPKYDLSRDKARNRDTQDSVNTVIK